MNRMSLRQRYLESLGVSAVSLSVSNLPSFYINYVKENREKVEAELNRVGYFVLKNKLSTGSSSTTTKDVFISTYFINMDMEYECNNMLSQKYHGDADVRSVGGFFVPSTNELVVLVRVEDESVEEAIKNADILSTVKHELVHAFDHTNKSDRLAKQNPTPGAGENFLSVCAYLGFVNRSDIANILGQGLFSDRITAECIYAISVILYKLFTLTEFNAHQVSDLEETNKVDPSKSEKLKQALMRDVLNDMVLTKNQWAKATIVDDDDNPYLWKLVGKVLSYLGYRLNKNSPSAVYNFFVKTGEKLLNKYFNKKLKNQSKEISANKEKNIIKNEIIECFKDDRLARGASFWFSPSGNTDSFICRVYVKSNKVNLTVNHKSIKIYGNVDGIFNRMIQSYNDNKLSAFEFAVANFVDVIIQSIERNFNRVDYDPMYDITAPQDEVQISKANKVANRFADLDWD